MTRKLIKVILLVIITAIFITSCGSKGNNTESNENPFEKKAIEVAREFILATQDNKEKIKELSFPTFLKEIEEKNWSLLLVEGIKIKPDTFEFNVENLSEKQAIVNVFYEAEMNKDGETINIKLSNKLGIIKHNDKPMVFSYE